MEKKFHFISGGFWADHQFVEEGTKYFNPRKTEMVVADEHVFKPGDHASIHTMSRAITSTVPKDGKAPKAVPRTRTTAAVGGGKVFATCYIK